MDEQQNEQIRAIAMKQHIQEQIYEETKDLTPEEFIAYIHRRIATSQFASFLAPSKATQPEPELAKKPE